MAAPSIAASNVAYFAVGATTTLTVSVPAHSSGDLLIMYMYSDSSREPWSQATPTGWNQLAKEDSNGTYELYTYWRIAGGSEPSTYDWTLNTTFGTGRAGMMAISGAEDPSSNAIESASSYETGASGSTTSPAVTPSDADSLVIRIVGNREVPTFTAPSGETLLFTSASDGNAMAISYFTHGASSTGTNTWSYSPTWPTTYPHLVLAIAPTAGGGSSIAAIANYYRRLRTR